ncbi:hypothetical protein JOC34_000845 [Virgibacillus halotolerans]|uniref:toll/interleukin-1 receptor domain-containing protein n=1 Tax=Virgibacillus halotolerans TaxID=1071053 RepID=UPI00195F97B7|nr:toll/interleukin-1 receptor domain-containing protein [Virgibacillus halotolerans]MBM7598488.1 hypothetical protein [Virgibacillus halotolerans]
MNTQAPTLFISYSHDSKEHKEWVKKLAYDLRVTGGVDALLDQWSVRLGGNLNEFMKNGLNDAKMVLCICTEEYVEKANKNIGGVGIEATIISNEISKGNKEHIIPIIRNNPNAKTPESLEGLLYEDFNDGVNRDNFKKLLGRIWSEDLKKLPPVGKNPFSMENFNEINYSVHLDQINYSNPEFEGKADFNYSHNDGKYKIGTGEYAFTTRWTKSGRTNIHAYKDSTNIERIGSFRNKITDFPQKDQLSTDDVDYTSRVRNPYLADYTVWMNKAGKFAVTKVVEINDADKKGDHNNLVFEYKIYDN